MMRSAERSEMWAKRFEIPLLVAALLVVPVIILQEAEVHGALEAIAQIGNWVIWLVFAAELVVMMAVVPDRKAWLRANPLAAPVVILTPPIAPAAMQSLRVLRLLRLLRLGRGFRIIRTHFNLKGLGYAAALVGFLVVAGGVAFSAIEDNQAGQQLSPWDGVWWAITTVTTVGYGDISPHTDAGRAIAMIIMIAGIGFVALLTAATAQAFVGQTVKEESEAIDRAEEAIAKRLEDISARLARIERAIESNGGQASQKAPGRGDAPRVSVETE